MLPHSAVLPVWKREGDAGVLPVETLAGDILQNDQIGGQYLLSDLWLLSADRWLFGGRDKVDLFAVGVYDLCVLGRDVFPSEYQRRKRQPQHKLCSAGLRLVMVVIFYLVSNSPNMNIITIL